MAKEIKNMSKGSIQYKLIKPHPSIADFVYCFSSLHELSDIDEGIIIPNGRIDLIFSELIDHSYQVSLLGLETKPKVMPPAANPPVFLHKF